MKKYKIFPLLGMFALLLSSCVNNYDSSLSSQTSSLNNNSTTNSQNSSTNSSSQTSSSNTSEGGGNIEIIEDYGLADTVQEGVILHAWNWSMANIKNALPEIASAGYTTIQTSPMQPQKDYSGQANWKSDWWKLYQPLGLSVATKNNALGTKSELKDLCAEADKYGIKIIVDVVSNHLGGGSSESFHQDIKNYEPEIYNNDLIHKGYGLVSDSNTRQLVRGHLGDYPDLMTENSIVQERVLSLLKEYVDCGVSGFRFDAAKHIETSFDGDYASNFWNYVLNGAQEYNISLGNEPLYYYGEILNTPGNGREISWYTDMMSITDNNASKNILNSVLYSASAIGNENIFSYSSLIGEKAVLWGESHDTYANDSAETTNISQQVINRAYAIAASRNDNTSLYFARPTSGATLGQISTHDFASNVITHVNKFHNQFVGSSNNIYYENNTFINVKNYDDDYGIILVNTGDSLSVNVKYDQLVDGQYIDQISGNVFTVSNNVISGTMDSSQIAVIYTPEIPLRPIINVSNDGSNLIYNPIDVEISVANADYSYYQINNGNSIEFDKSTIVKIGDGVSSGEISLKIYASNEKYQVSKEIIYHKRDKNNLTVTVSNISNDEIEDKNIFAWVWKSGDDGRWVEGNLVGNSYSFDVTTNDTHFLLASFPSSTTINNVDWPLCIRQTADQQIDTSKIYDSNDLSWRDYL